MKVATIPYKINYTHQHADFDAAHPDGYELNILASGSTFAYLLNTPEGQVHAIKEYRFNSMPDLDAWKQVLESDPFLKERYKKVTWISDDERFLLCPEEYLRYEEADKLFAQLRSPWDKIGILQKDTLEDSRLCVLYEPEYNLAQFLSARFTSFEYRHWTSRCLYHAHRVHQESMPLVSMVITAWDGKFCLNVFNRTGLVLTQLFKAKTAEDYLYYLLWVCQNLNIAHEHVSLTLSGQFRTQEPVIDLLQKYFQPVKYMAGLNPSVWYAADTRVPVLHYIALLPEIV